ncbi:MAG: serine/threonine-protein kinase [Anaeromyxobacteraceae bacterium]
MATDPASPQQPPCSKCGYLADTSAGPVNFCPACGQDLRQAGASTPKTLKHAYIGQVVAERYRLLSLVGEGGMGAVFKAEHVRMGKALALKILRGDYADDEGAIDRFRSEAAIVSRLSHPHTIAVFDFGEVEGTGGLYLAMEYVPGKDLAHLLKGEGKLHEERAAEIGQQILGSLAEAHEAGIVHRDVKPGNVMLMQARPGEDFVKVLDFGIAKFRDEKGSLTGAGTIIGTPSYLAPEQARGDDVDNRTDLYALGCLLYELTAGHPPFVKKTPMEVVGAHLREEPPPLEREAPHVSTRFAEIVHRALQKDPADRWQNADQMRDALLALGRGSPAGEGQLPAHFTTGELEIANRDDFKEFEAQLAALERSHRALPVALATAGLAVVLAALVAWQWDGVYGLLARKLPAVAQAVPAALRPATLYDGNEHEPNDVPDQANPLPIPPGPQGQPAGGVAVMRGFIGPKLSEDAGDADIYRIEVPKEAGLRVLAAEWHGEKPGEGIRGLDVALSLNRAREGGDPRSSAPLVATVNRGGPGRPELLAASVEPGTYFLTVREVHGRATGPVEKPSDPYVLELRLGEAGPGQELEPNDAPDRVAARFQRYPEWRELASRNVLGEGSPVRGDTSAEDWDTWAVAPRQAGEAPEAIVGIPEPDLALEAKLWTPDGKDLEPPSPPVDRVRFGKPQAARPGEILAVRLAGVPRAEAPALLAIHAASGAGSYALLGLGQGAAAAAAVREQVDALARDGREVAALQLAAAYAGLVPRAPGRAEALVAAGRIAESLADRVDPEVAALHDRAAKLLGAPIFEAAGNRVRYRGAFEARVQGEGRSAEEAGLRLVRLAAPCTPVEVAARAAAFLAKKPAADLAEEARLLRARALEEAYFAAPRERGRLGAAQDAWRAVGTTGRNGAEAKARLRALGAKAPARAKVAPVCE